MSDGAFSFEDCLMKHHIRKNAWLPLCKHRLDVIRKNNTTRRQRRLKYFTFCAVGAIDVLMLDVAKVIRPNKWRFDTVYFFAKTPENVQETQKRIPGAIGFPGDFTSVVLLDDVDDDVIASMGDNLLPPSDQGDTLMVRHNQRLVGQHRSFRQSFPFDIINLDLEEFLFKPNDPMPGRVVNALRKIIEWQQRPIESNNLHSTLDGFGLMFTTQIGPRNISQEYIQMLEKSLRDNLNHDPALLPLLTKRTEGIDNITILRENNFDIFFTLAMPKILAEILLDCDWYVDPDQSISIYEFERKATGGAYKMLHIVLEVKRQTPTYDLRHPRHSVPRDAAEAHQYVIRQLFDNTEKVITEENIDRVALQYDLDLILSRRKKYLAMDGSA